MPEFPVYFMHNRFFEILLITKCPREKIQNRRNLGLAGNSQKMAFFGVFFGIKNEIEKI